jgi:hypothetical protein
MVRRPDAAAVRYATFTAAMTPLVDALTTVYSSEQVNILKCRFLAIVDSAERDSKRSNWWDSRLFLLGFGGSLLVTVAAAISQAGYMTSDAITIVNTMVLLMSSIGTAALGLRERLKFREKADISQRLSSALQQRGFMFMAPSGKYASMEPLVRFQTFVMDVESLKLRADHEHQALRIQEDQHAAPNAHPISTVLRPEMLASPASPSAVAAATSPPFPILPKRSARQNLSPLNVSTSLTALQNTTATTPPTPPTIAFSV